jgi:hypothetical protein
VKPPDEEEVHGEQEAVDDLHADSRLMTGTPGMTATTVAVAIIAVMSPMKTSDATGRPLSAWCRRRQKP